MERRDLDFSIVTPSLNMLGYLKLCCASVSDQGGISMEHLVVDAGSTDGTVDWLMAQDGVTAIVEEDKGMYDAVNKGFRRARGKFLAYLNCDEQYLPEVLRFVKHYFDTHLRVDILFGSVLIVLPDGSLLSYRKAYQPRWRYIWTSHLYLHSCAMFIRRNVVENGILFDDNLRDIGDKKFVIDCLRADIGAAYVQNYFSAFTMTGNNMSTHTNAQLEREEFVRTTPILLRLMWYPLNIARLTEKILAGSYFQKFPLLYELYTPTDTCTRTKFASDKSSFRWNTK